MRFLLEDSETMDDENCPKGLVLIEIAATERGLIEQRRQAASSTSVEGSTAVLAEGTKKRRLAIVEQARKARAERGNRLRRTEVVV